MSSTQTDWISKLSHPTLDLTDFSKINNDMYKLIFKPGKICDTKWSASKVKMHLRVSTIPLHIDNKENFENICNKVKNECERISEDSPSELLSKFMGVDINKHKERKITEGDDEHESDDEKKHDAKDCHAHVNCNHHASSCKPTHEGESCKTGQQTDFLSVCNKINVITDTKESGEPFELLLNKSFSFPPLEQIVKTMNVGEKSVFVLSNSLSKGYIQLEIALRKIRDKKNGGKKTCAAGFMEDLDTYSELYQLDGMPLEFTIECLEFITEENEHPFTLSAIEKVKKIPQLKDEGVSLVKSGKFKEASIKFALVLDYIENLLMLPSFSEIARGKDNVSDPLVESDPTSCVSKDWIEGFQVSCRLNYILCALKLGDYKVAISQADIILKKDPSNLKALFRRAQAYISQGRDLDSAKDDLNAFEKLLESCPNVVKNDYVSDIARERKKLLELENKRYKKSKEMFSNIFK
ncbi:hypothetical protein ROZALSC1DRAFT_28548 [Rozella allomycis CSF55]|uniref:Uncharacterized protein n=1 Tax=Rozella allomycis (strain CSF55) TaxID=988480 RepID=A0A075B464_ROZAC|nr:hypothetical protein O9G_002698 [Rozella allomycis CSF55]RKP19897.1 hypothetical protein ROZALSC1DRAFT_28548 [Rozella allomycis CSF55]|eukprot:EPZ36055.1 hypothetical protein O9G_002698 [Rozella allomycis CSF55]